MGMIRRWAVLSLIGWLALTGGCAWLQSRDPLHVSVAGVEPLPGEGMELRMLVKLRIQNPNETPVAFNGAFIEMSVQGKEFASGVSDQSGNVPRFGESLVAIPVTISAFNLARQAMGMMSPKSQQIDYALSGKLSGATFESVRFKSSGQLTLPARQ